MTKFGLVLRTLNYFRGVNIAVIAGVAVATAVLSGALMVGDSVRGSLRDLAIQRLGKVDHALIAGRFFEGTLAQRLAADPTIGDRFEIAPAIITQGGISRDSTSTRAAGVQIIGAGADWVPVAPGQSILNGQTAEAIDLNAAGADIVLSVPTESDIPRDATLARRSRQDTLSGMRARVASIVAEPGFVSLFNPAGGQRAPQNAWVNLPDLQQAVGQRGRVNTLLVHDKAPSADAARVLNGALRSAITVADYGLSTRPVSDGREVALTSRTTYLDPPIELATGRIADDSGIPVRKISINLINAVNRLTETGETASSIHYAVAAGITSLDDGILTDDEVALNEWAAERLGAKVGDRISLAFYHRQSDGSLLEVHDTDQGFSNHFRVARILPMSGLGADASLTPSYEGLTDADSIASWNPPSEVKIDKRLVTAADEAYWKHYKAAPKLFFNFETSRLLWGVGFGDATSVRIPTARADEFIQKLLALVHPSSMGLTFRALKQEQLAAAGGSTDFGQLFIGFSFFLIVAAALLVAMLLRLGVEQRSRQLGALLALGFAPRDLRKLMLVEGMILAICGGIVGTFLAIGYTWLMMAGLRTWWVGAIGTTAMRLHVQPVTLVIGFGISQIVALCASAWAVRQAGRSAPARLLAGGWEATQPVRRSGSLASRLGIVGLLTGLALIAAGMIGAIGQQAAFLAGGTILLASTLCLLGTALRSRRGGGSIQSLANLAIRNATRHPARSVLSIGLIAFAAFALVTVAAMRQGEPSDTENPQSGSGGYQLIVESEIPFHGNPATQEGRGLLAFRNPSDPIWDRVEFLSMRRRSGQDVSCLNLTRASSPTILAVPDSLIERGGFTSARDNPWKLLKGTDSDGAIPVIADTSTATYILHLSLGDVLDVMDPSGISRKLKLVATLPHSIFQSQLLMSEENFQNTYPRQSGLGLLLVRTKPEDQEQVRRLLSDDLNEYGASLRTTASVMAEYLQVQNTYLSTFELLGALGLMLGTIGLAVVLVRTVIERKAEFALLTALGFRLEARIRLVLMENAFLLVTGLLIGMGCALIGILPALLDSSRGINVVSLGLTLAASLLTGLFASGFAVLLSSGNVTPADLRKE